MKSCLSTVMVAVVMALGTASSQAQQVSSSAAMGVAQALLQPGQAAARLAKASVFDAFVPRIGGEVHVDVAGEAHLRFDRTYQGLPVMGGDIIVHLTRDGQLSRVTTTLVDTLHLTSVVPSIDQAAARAQAEGWFQQEGRALSTSAELMVVAVPSLVPQPTLAWLVKVRGSRCGQPSWMHYVIDASTGALHRKYEGQRSLVAIECAKGDAAASTNVPFHKAGSGRRAAGAGVSPMAAATGTGSSLYLGSVSIDTDKISDTQYLLRDTTRGSHFVSDFVAGMGTPMSDADNAWGDGTTADRATVAVDAAYGQAKTWDYYKNVHSRNGIANDGAGYSSTVHYQEFSADVDNAFWDGTRMKYGDGATLCKPLVSLDIAGHEMTHGVTQKTANLTYAGESGGLNESTSDIFGTMIEFYAGNATDTPDYLIGEKIVKAPGLTALRFMYQPSLDVGIFSDTSRDCWSTGVNALDPHFSSGIGNHFYYLLTEGSKPSGQPASKVCKATDNTNASDTIKFTGMGRFNAEQLWYHALTNNFTASTDYKAARLATLESAKSLYGDDSGWHRLTDYAWLAVNVTDVPKVTSYTTNKSWQTAQIVTPAPELVIMGRPGAAGKSHWYALYLDAGKSAEANLTAADATSNFDLVGFDSTGKKKLAASKTAGGAKEKMTIKNDATTRKLVYVSVPLVSGTAPYSLRLKML